MMPNISWWGHLSGLLVGVILISRPGADLFMPSTGKIDTVTETAPLTAYCILYTACCNLFVSPGGLCRFMLQTTANNNMLGFIYVILILCDDCGQSVWRTWTRAAAAGHCPCWEASWRTRTGPSCTRAWTTLVAVIAAAVVLSPLCWGRSTLPSHVSSPTSPGPCSSCGSWSPQCSPWQVSCSTSHTTYIACAMYSIQR